MGGTTSGNYSNTPGSHQPNPSPDGDAYFAQFDFNGALLYSTFYGGAREESAFTCAADPLGSFYLGGFSNSFGGTAIATPGSYQPSYPGTNSNGAPNSFLVKFSTCNPLQISSNQSNPTCAGFANGSATINANAGGDPLSYSWTPVTGSGSVITSLPAGSYTCVVSSSCGVTIQQTISMSGPPALSLSALPSPTSSSSGCRQARS